MSATIANKNMSVSKCYEHEVTDEEDVSYFDQYLYSHQKQCITEQSKYKKCLVNMWCGTGKTRTFTIDLFESNQNMNVIVFPSLGLINQYANDYNIFPH